MIPVGVAREVVDDLRALPVALQQAAQDMMRELRFDAHRGQRLLWKQGPRSACRRLYFDTSDAERSPAPDGTRDPRPQGSRYRIVYELLPDDANPTYIRVLAVGAKIPADEDVYEKAERRRD